MEVNTIIKVFVQVMPLLGRQKQNQTLKLGTRSFELTEAVHSTDVIVALQRDKLSFPQLLSVPSALYNKSFVFKRESFSKKKTWNDSKLGLSLAKHLKDMQTTNPALSWR